MIRQGGCPSETCLASVWGSTEQYILVLVLYEHATAILGGRFVGFDSGRVTVANLTDSFSKLRRVGE